MRLKNLILYGFAVLLLVAAFFAWRIFGSNTGFEEKSRVVYIKQNTSFRALQVYLDTNHIVNNTRTFRLLAKLLKYPENIRPGRYEIAKGSSIYTILRQLKSGKQTPVKLVINKLRTREDLARKIGAGFECDSADVIQFLNNPDSLKQFGYDTNTVMTAVIPDTYEFLWTTGFAGILKRLNNQKERFWTSERKQKAAALGLTPEQVYTLASIVEEETNKQDDKGKIASVYLNRIEKGMPLGADPTVRFALRSFAMQRVYRNQLSVASSYNTYINKGLPPGPICTPSQNTIDAVLAAPATDYLYFVAKPSLDGYSNFAATYQEHLYNAKIYQEAINKLGIK